MPLWCRPSLAFGVPPRDVLTRYAPVDQAEPFLDPLRAIRQALERMVQATSACV
jgi:hypothetical protein